MDGQKQPVTEGPWHWPLWKVPDFETDNFYATCKLWFKQLGLAKPWDSTRAMLACEIVGLTPVQLGALCGVKAWEMRAFLKRDSIPIPVCLHFMLIEQWFREVVLGAKGDCKTLTIPVHLIGRVNTLSKALVKARMIDIRRRREEVRLRAVQRRRDRLALKAAEPPAPPPPVKLQKPPKLMYDPSRVMKPRILLPKTHAFSFAQDSQHD